MSNLTPNLTNATNVMVAVRTKHRLALFGAILPLVLGCIFILRNTPKPNQARIDLSYLDKRIFQATPIVDNDKTKRLSDKLAELTIGTSKPITVTINSRDNLKKIFNRQGVDTDDAAAILALQEAKVLKQLKPGNQLNLILDSTMTRVRGLKYEINPLDTLVVLASNGGWKVSVKHIEPTVTTRYVSAKINKSIYHSGKLAGIPSRIIAQMVKVFGSKMNVDMLYTGDRIALFYNEYTANGKRVKNSELAAAEIVHRGKTIRVFGFSDDGSGKMRYYTADGHSVEPTFLRYPLKSFRRISSRFSLNRKHPIFGVVRPHLGVDLSAPRGTPIMAASDGQIIFADRKGGYGRMIMIKTGAYTTAYAHLSKFAKKTKRGRYVKQGDIIGYVGSTGVSTSPHLHYEVRVNGKHKDPLKVKFPDGSMIAKKNRNNFFAFAKKMSAQLDLHYENGGKNFAMHSSTTKIK